MKGKMHWGKGALSSRLSDIDAFVKQQLVRYGLNLLAVHPLTKEFLAFILTLLGAKTVDRFVAHANSTGKKESDKSMPLIENQHDLESLAEDVLKGVLQKKLGTTERKLSLYLQKALQGATGARSRRSITSRRLQDICNLLSLDPHELDVVALLYCYSQNEQFERLCDSRKLPSFLKLVAAATACPMWQLRRLLAHRGKLVSSGVVTNVNPDGRPPAQLDDEVTAYLAGIADMPLAEKYCKKATGRPLKLQSFNVAEQSVDVVRSLIERQGQCHILLYGSPGTGKTEFAKSLIAAAGKQGFFVQHGEEQTRSRFRSLNRKMALQVAMACASEDSGIVVVDEADEILNTRYFVFGCDTSVDKGWLNTFMDGCNRTIIWITNDTEYMEESTLRRFAYSLHFKRFTRGEREQIWKGLLRRHPLRRYIPGAMVHRMADVYRINASGIASALETLKTVVPPAEASTESVSAVLTDLLDRHLDALGRRKPSDLNVLTDRYDIGSLNADIAPKRVVRSLKSFLKAKQEAGTAAEGNMNLLFWGLPGTGKTEYAKYLAHTTSSGLLIKRASDLLSMWVGGTEANIRAAFEEAERDKSILFLDEADSFFINRENAVRSWETSQTNELLTQMENHKGILICCTNLLDQLDRAVIRRFMWKVHFRPLTQAGRIALFQKYFAPDTNALPGYVCRWLEQLDELTPGDIKVVWQKTRFVGENVVDYRETLEALENEVAYKRGNQGGIGFHAGRH